MNFANETAAAGLLRRSFRQSPSDTRMMSRIQFIRIGNWVTDQKCLHPETEVTRKVCT